MSTRSLEKEPENGSAHATHVNEQFGMEYFDVNEFANEIFNFIKLLVCWTG